MLTQRQWTQCRAALRYWQIVAKRSRVHPMEHPKIQEIFGEATPPLTATEIEALIQQPNIERVSVVTLAGAAKKHGVSVGRFKKWLTDRGIEPVCDGQPALYNKIDISRAALELAQ